ncbi:hypothetical protein BSKO_05604 [Bryopsis sp. KO-2023]|nr:hypothetical protein BSKO_05604 [Bryopsis sp. KO-2023]
MYSRNNSGHPADSQPQYLTQSARLSTELSKAWSVMDSEARSYSVATKSDSSSPTTFSIPAVTTEHQFGQFSLFPGSPNVPPGQAQTYFSSTAPRDYGGLASSPSFSTSFLRNHLGQVPHNASGLHLASTWNIGPLGKGGGNDYEQVQRMQSSPGFSSTWPRVNDGGGGAVGGDQIATIARLRGQVRELTAQLHARRARAQAKSSAREPADQKEDGNSLAVRVRVDEEAATSDQGSSSTPMSPVSSSLVTKIGDLKQKIVNGLMGESVEPLSQEDSEVAASDSDLAERGLCENCRRTSSDEVSLVGDDDDDAFPGFRTPTISENGEEMQDQEFGIEIGETNLGNIVEDGDHALLNSLDTSEGDEKLSNEIDALKSVGPDLASETSLDTSEVNETCSEMDALEPARTDSTVQGILDAGKVVESSNELDVESDRVDHEDKMYDEGGSETDSDGEQKPLRVHRKVSIEHPPNWRIEGWSSKSEDEDHTTGIESLSRNPSDSDFAVQDRNSLDEQTGGGVVEGALADGGQGEEEVEPQVEEVFEPGVEIGQTLVDQLEDNIIIETSPSLDTNEDPPPSEDLEEIAELHAQENPDTPPEEESIGTEGAPLGTAEEVCRQEEIEPQATEDSSECESLQENPIMLDDDSEATFVEHRPHQATSDTEETFHEEAVQMNEVLRMGIREDSGNFFSSASEDTQAPLESDNKASLDGSGCEDPSEEDSAFDITGNLFESMGFVQTVSDLEDAGDDWSSKHSQEPEQEESDANQSTSDVVSEHSVDEDAPSIENESLSSTHGSGAEESNQQSFECVESPDSFWEGLGVDEETDQHEVEPSADSISASSIVEVQEGEEPEEPLFQNANQQIHPEVDREESVESLGVTLAHGIGCAADSDSESSVDMEEVDGVASRELSMRMAKGMQLSSFPIDHGSDVSDFSE